MPVTALPAGRAFEQVSPEFKGGYGVSAIYGVTPNGEKVALGSFGAFAGAQTNITFNYYVAQRAPTGWSTTSTDPPAELSPEPIPVAIAPSVDSQLWILLLDAPNAGSVKAAGKTQQFAVGTGGAFVPVGPILERLDKHSFVLVPFGTDDAFCHIVFSDAGGPLLAEANGLNEQLYESVSGCANEATTLRIVPLTDAGALFATDCLAFLGGSGGEFNAVSADGREVFFETSVPSSPGCASGVQLFVRVAGATTLEVSKPLAETCSDVPCPGSVTRLGAEFQGASENGTRVFFTTAAPLDSTSDTDAGSDLYMAVIGCPGEAGQCPPEQALVTSLVQVSHDPNIGESADVQGVISVAPDGSRVYFVARGLLSTEGPITTGTQQQPIAGADNVYMYERDAKYPAGRTSFVGDLCSSASHSGELEDPRCPGDLEKEASSIAPPPRNDAYLWREKPYTPVQTADPEGKVVVFSAYARLVDAGLNTDSDNAQDVYRYDAESNTLDRVSVGENGHGANGNGADTEPAVGEKAENADARVQDARTGSTLQEERKIVRRAVSEDGSRIVFRTSESLSSSASNGLPDVYEWHEGRVALISTGSSVEPDEDPVITPPGNDLFLVTAQDLVGSDADGAYDVYDSRIGGGFPTLAADAHSCSSDACQGPLTNPFPLLIPGSASASAEEKLPPPRHTLKKKVRRKTKKKGKKVRKAKRAAHSRVGDSRQGARRGR